MVSTTALITKRMRRGGASPRVLPSPSRVAGSPSSTASTVTLRTPEPLRVRHPNDLNLNVQMQRSVSTLNESFRPTNTSKAHNPKIEEFFGFCDDLYADDPYKYNLNYEKVYRFMFFQAFRELKKRGGRRTDGGKFDRASYNQVMAAFDGEPRSPGENAPMPIQSMKPISWSSFDQYKQIIRKIYRTQVLEQVNSLEWERIWQQPLIDLSKQVKLRVPFVRKATYQEKITAEFAPYTIVERYPDIEKELWNDSAKAVGPRQVCCQLRHRYCSQHTASGILRSESLHRAEFSDFLMIRAPKTESDVHALDIMVNQIAIGKTNHGRLLYGRAMRHRDVRLCAVGSLSFYTMYRFHVTREFSDMTLDDWLDNSKWFDIKLLADTHAANKSVEMGSDSYGRHIAQVLARLGLPGNKLLHLGRNIGAKILDLLEEEDEAIRKMGQWSPSVYDNSYSSKLPMGPMRKLAGFHGSNRLYFNQRTAVEPPDELLLSTPIGAWVYKMWDEAIKDPGIEDHPTAMHVLRFFMMLNRVFIQDATAMVVLHTERMDHPLYREMPLFSSQQFMVSSTW
jgi:Centromere DNA-binding protein complex CBF3 subunit, domain 2